MLSLDPNDRFRERRRQARRRRAIRRVTAVGVVVVAAGSVALGARFFGESDPAGSTPAAKTTKEAATAPAPQPPQPRPYPSEMRGVHVTMALMTLDGKFEEYLSYKQKGMNTFQLDVKDENGEVAFRSPHAPLAARIGAAQDYYRPRPVVKRIHDAGLYLIGRVVVFEDPFLARAKPGMAIQRAGGGIWTNYSGLGWANQYDKRVWKYNVDVAESAARAGFDEIMFDYVRFPSDGPIESAVWPGKVKGERMGVTIGKFLEYARGRLEPLGVRVSAAIFGLSATRDLGIGQRPRYLAPHLDAVYPMVYPSHYSPGEYDIDDPNGNPGATVQMSLRTFRRALRGTNVRIIPWLQDFTLGRTYGLAEVEAQIQAARRMGSPGYLLWNAAGVYTVDALGL